MNSSVKAKTKVKPKAEIMEYVYKEGGVSCKYYIPAGPTGIDTSNIREQYYASVREFGACAELQSDYKEKVRLAFDYFCTYRDDMRDDYLAFKRVSYTALSRRLVVVSENNTIVVKTQYYVPYRVHEDPSNLFEYTVIEIQGDNESDTYLGYTQLRAADIATRDLALSQETEICDSIR